jgi:uncharacterized protein YfaS (alpha-2-macroglobulin family)
MEEDNYIRIRKNSSTVQVDPFLEIHSRKRSRDCQLTLENAYGSDVDNIVITDLLPAGLKSRTRTKEIPGMDWIKEASTPTALDVRDDRINLFVDLKDNRQTYYYAVSRSPGFIVWVL